MIETVKSVNSDALENPLPEEEPFVILDDEQPADEFVSENIASRSDELDGLRIRNLVHLRRANIRSQTYAIIGLIGCVVATIEVGLSAWRRHSIPFALVAVVTAIVAFLLAFYADRLRHEIESTDKPLTIEPDFEPLSDGSQYVDNLHVMIDTPNEKREFTPGITEASSRSVNAPT